MVGGHTKVLEDESTVEEEELIAVGAEGGVEGHVQSGIGGGGKCRADVDEGLRDGGRAEGRAQESDVVQLVVGNLGSVLLRKYMWVRQSRADSHTAIPYSALP